MARKKEYLLRLDAELFQEIQAWAGDDLRSVNGQIEFLLRRAVGEHRRRIEPSEEARHSEVEQRSSPED